MLPAIDGRSPRSTVCVIGGSGCIGSHVADALTRSGRDVRIYDRRPSRWLRDGQEMVLGSLDSTEELAAAVHGCDAVFHFAGMSDLDATRESPVDAAEHNVLGTARALDACRRAGVRRFLYASTVYAYSREGGFYRCSKQAAELFVEEFGRSFGMEFVILRFGSIYGPRSDETNGLYRLVRSALASGTLSYAGNPDAVREYVHVQDVADACLEALVDSFRNQCLIITGRESTPVKEIALMLAEILGLPGGGIRFVDEGRAGHYIRTPYSDMPRLAHKYTPALHVDLGQGLLQLVGYVRDRERGGGTA